MTAADVLLAVTVTAFLATGKYIAATWYFSRSIDAALRWDAAEAHRLRRIGNRWAWPL